MKKKNIAIVTGASSGLGKEFVKLLSAKKGLDEIWIISRNEEKLKKIQKRYGEKIVVYPMDLSSLENIKTFGENPSLKNCNIRYLINNAGFAKFCSYDDISIDESINMIDLNISGVVAMGLVCIPHMKKGSHILNIASQASFQPLPYQNIYSSTKAFVRNYTRALNVELREKGITATAVCPGWIKTEFFSHAIHDNTVSYFNRYYGPKEVIEKAVKDMHRNKPVSILGLPERLQVLGVKLLPTRFVLKTWCKQQKKPFKY